MSAVAGLSLLTRKAFGNGGSVVGFGDTGSGFTSPTSGKAAKQLLAAGSWRAGGWRLQLLYRTAECIQGLVLLPQVFEACSEIEILMGTTRIHELVASTADLAEN